MSPLKDSLCRRTAISKEDSARLVLVFFFFQADLAWYILGGCTAPGNMLLHVFPVKWYVT